MSTYDDTAGTGAVTFVAKFKEQRADKSPIKNEILSN